MEPQKQKAFKLYEKYKDKLNDLNVVIQKELELPFYNISQFDLSTIKSDPNNVFINFKNYLNGFSKNVLDIIENFKILELVNELNKNNSLYSIIDKFTEFDLHPNKVDNHQMGTIYEELLRKFSEMTNEESGDYFTPRDVVKLLVSLVFDTEKNNLKQPGIIKSIYDPCCGTGGMLTISKEWIGEKINKDLKIELFGQERNPITYAICKSDFLMSDENPEISEDQLLPCQRISIKIENLILCYQIPLLDKVGKKRKNLLKMKQKTQMEDFFQDFQEYLMEHYYFFNI